MPLSHREVSVLGGKAIGEKKKKEALERYYQNPNHCQWCEEIIHPKVGKRGCVAEAGRKKFCSRSCSAQYTNRVYPKRQAISSGPCEECGVILHYKKMKKGHYSHRRFCADCLQKRRAVTASKWSLSRTNGDNGPVESYVAEITLDELRKRHPTYQNYRSVISKHARKVYDESGLPRKCKACGYDYHVDICHIKHPGDFPGNTRVVEVNELTNLLPLCKNHHKEFDDGVLNIGAMV